MFHSSATNREPCCGSCGSKSDSVCD